MEITPTALEPAAPLALTFQSQWSEVLNEAGAGRSLVDTKDMEWQFACHLYYGAAFVKPALGGTGAYDLDTYIHRSSFQSYLNNYCN